jgi:hypothetical protein
MITGTVRRPYQTRSSSRRGAWITIRLPEGFIKFLTLYARSTGRSRNRALNLFLKAGLLLYLAGYNKFLRTIITESKSRLTGSGTIHKFAYQLPEGPLRLHIESGKIAVGPLARGFKSRLSG